MAKRATGRKRGAPVGAGSTALPKTPTGIAGLDEVLHGGLAVGRTTLVSGRPGTGKSVLGMEFLYRSALAGEPGIFVGFEEDANAVRQNASTLGWDVAALEREKKLFLMQARMDPETIVSGEFSMKGFLAILAGKSKEMGATRLVVDALEVLIRSFGEPVRIRAELYTFTEWLGQQGLTAILTIKPRSNPMASAYEDYLDSLIDCAIHLDQRVVEQVTTRRLQVLKYRGSNFARNEHPYVIGQHGFTVIPISALELRHTAPGKTISSGHTGLDAILGGGVAQGTCFLFAGLPGTGKTILASTFAQAACKRGEKVIYLQFEESADAMIRNVSSAGIDLDAPCKSGMLTVLSIMPESTGSEEHLVRVLEPIDSVQPRHLVVDAISACNRMGGTQAAFEFLMRLMDICKGRGITVFLLNQTSGRNDMAEISGNEISSMVDSVVLLDYVQSRGETNRTLRVMKSRGSAHSNQIREFVITSNGIKIVDVYVGEAGVLTGTARKEQEQKDAVEDRRVQTTIDATKERIECLKAAQALELAKLQAEVMAQENELITLQLEQDKVATGRSARAEMRGEDGDSEKSLVPRSSQVGKRAGRKGGAK